MKTEDRAATIAQILKPLPDEAQEAMVQLLRQAVVAVNAIDTARDK